MPPNAAPGVHKNGSAQIDLSSGNNAFDLDDWATGYPPLSNLDFTVNYATISGTNGAVVAKFFSPTDPATPTYANCRYAVRQGAATDVPISSLKPNASLCMLTNEGRIAILKVNALPVQSENRSLFEFAATVWATG
ncbi:MAG: hypothetical protein LC776_15435 [Acidobacteria bacterium]|nr:hypothetical protein [Acidobacteriota bacterium]